MANRNFWRLEDDFFGTRVFSFTQADDPNWFIDIAGSAVVPTLITPSSTGEVNLILESTGEIQSVNLYQKDILQFDIDKIREVEWRVKQGQATLDATSKFDFGIASARADDTTTIAAFAFFGVLGSGDTTALVINTDGDGAEDNNNIATGQSIVATYKDFRISFAEGTDDVRFFIDGQPVATSTTFDMSNYTGSLQLYAQISKTSDTNTDGITIDRVSIRGVR